MKKLKVLCFLALSIYVGATFADVIFDDSKALNMQVKNLTLKAYNDHLTLVSDEFHINNDVVSIDFDTENIELIQAEDHWFIKQAGLAMKLAGVGTSSRYFLENAYLNMDAHQAEFSANAFKQHGIEFNEIYANCRTDQDTAEQRFQDIPQFVRICLLGSGEITMGKTLLSTPKKYFNDLLRNNQILVSNEDQIAEQVDADNQKLVPDNVFKKMTVNIGDDGSFYLVGRISAFKSLKINGTISLNESEIIIDLIKVTGNLLFFSTDYKQTIKDSLAGYADKGVTVEGDQIRIELVAD